MARTTRPLTNTEVLRAKALEKDLTLHDGDGLFLIVKTSGKKLWRFRYQRPVTKQRTMMGPGTFPALSLADARGLRADYLALAHIESNDVRKAYNRSTYLEHRKELMDWWGMQCTSAKDGTVR